MTFLPVVDRELRVRARLKSTYRIRLVAACGASVVVGLMLLWAGGGWGDSIFKLLSWIAFGYCLLEGARNTSDCLSEEKRGGTLGLLFLTDLKAHDVVLGKLVATSLNSLYGLLAMVPALAVPLVVGGVTVGEFWRMVLVLINTLFFSAAAGLWVSAISRDARRAWEGTISLVLLAAVVPRLLFPMLGSGWSFLAALSPAAAFFHAFDAANVITSAPYWRAFGTVHVVAWGFVVAAAWVLPRAWQDRPRTETALATIPSWMKWRAVAQEGSMRAARSRILTVNPASWLVLRSGKQQRFLWVLVISASVTAVGAWVLAAGSGSIGTAIVGSLLLVHWTIAAWLAGEACHLFAHGRDSGLLDLMLCTPLKIKEIVDGHVMGLKRVVYAPVATLVAVEGILLAAHVYVMAESGASSGRCAFVAVFVLFTIAAVLLDLAAVTQYGLWQGLKTRKSTRAVTKTVLYVLVFPLGIVCLGGPILLLLKNLILMNHAHQQLKRTFRPLVTGRYGWGDESEFIGQPSRAAMRGRMPPVLMR